MNRSTMFRRIFSELHDALAGAASEVEILECAQLVLNCAEDEDVGNHYKLRKLRTPFIEMGLDELIEKYSWKVMCQEYHVEDDYIPRPRPQDVINQLFNYAT